MRSILVLFAVLAVSFAIGFADLSAFDSWAKKYGKTYNTAQEKAVRMRNFVASLQRIGQKNANNTNGAMYGLTKFSDMTPEEFSSTVLMKNRIFPQHNVEVDILKPSRIGAPSSFDWRTASNTPITPVKDQGQCGSCWAFSVAETAESVNILNGNGNANSLRVSEQQIVDCDTSDDGCNGGLPESAWTYIISTGGLDSESSYPYTAEDGTCQFNAKNIVAKVSGWKYATSSGDETTLQTNLLAQPISICVDAANWQDYTSGVMTAWECAWVVELDHCVQLVGYNSGASPAYWIVRNSWGTTWGESGYIRLTMGENTCGLTEEATMPQYKK